MISPEFEPELVKKVLGKPADPVEPRRSTQIACTRNLFQHRRQDVTAPPGRGSVVGLCDLEGVAQRNLASTAEHTAALHERFARSKNFRKPHKKKFERNTFEKFERNTLEKPRETQWRNTR